MTDDIRDTWRPPSGPTRNTYGTAAEKILDGAATATNIDQAIADCVWCEHNRRGARNQCWHQAAKVLLDHGLRSGAALHSAPHQEPVSDGMLF